MPGFGNIDDVRQESEARRNSGGGGNFARLYLRLDDGEEAVGRFLEQGDTVKFAYFHTRKGPDDGQFGKRFICLDQDENGRRTGADCPGCEEKLSRSVRGFFNFLWRDAPVFKRDAEDKIVKDGNKKMIVDGYADQVALWETNEDTVFDLSEVDSTYKGLGSRDFRVKRRGKGIGTAYFIQPADPDGGPQPMSDADKKLAEEQANDLDLFVTKPSYEEWGKTTAKSSTPEPSKTSPFRRPQAA